MSALLVFLSLLLVGQPVGMGGLAAFSLPGGSPEEPMPVRVPGGRPMTAKPSAAPAYPKGETGSPFNGTWQGSVVQTPEGAQRRYPVRLTISDGGGSIDYPSLGCGGMLTVENDAPGVLSLRERLTYGQTVCIDQGLVELRPSGGRLDWTWSLTLRGTKYLARSSLSRLP